MDSLYSEIQVEQVWTCQGGSLYTEVQVDVWGVHCVVRSNASWLMATWYLVHWTDRQTHTTQNITSLQLRWWAVIRNKRIKPWHTDGNLRGRRTSTMPAGCHSLILLAKWQFSTYSYLPLLVFVLFLVIPWKQKNTWTSQVSISARKARFLRLIFRRYRHLGGDSPLTRPEHQISDPTKTD